LTQEGLAGLEEVQKRPSSLDSGGVDLLEKIAQATENHVPIQLDAIGSWCDWAYLVDLDQNTFEVYLLNGRGREELSMMIILMT
jgi:hypothetical protein